MTPAARIQAVIDIFSEIMGVLRPADTLVSHYFRNRRFIGSSDRQAINTRLYRIMREYHRLSWWIKKAEADVHPRTLAIADQMFEREQNADSLENIFSGERYAPDKMDEKERKLARLIEKKELMPPEMSLREKTECPEWAFLSLQKALGDRYEMEMQAMMIPASLNLRVNIIKTNRADVLKQLQDDGIDAHAGKVSPMAIRIFERPQLSQHFLFKEGYVEVQDEGSQMVAILADAQPGEQVVDFCAGAGGKTLAMAASMDNKGRVVALDVLGGRLQRAKLRFRRAGLFNIETRELTSERDKWVKHHQGSFDMVLLDVPCTGTGTWRRDPDKRWRQLGPGLGELVPLQKDIIESAWRMVKPGGRLVYATCSLLPEENEAQVESFLAAHPDFEIVPAETIVKVPGAGKFLQLTPSQHDTDGFFGAVMKRKAVATT